MKIRAEANKIGRRNTFPNSSFVREHLLPWPSLNTYLTSTIRGVITLGIVWGLFYAEVLLQNSRFFQITAVGPQLKCSGFTFHDCVQNAKRTNTSNCVLYFFILKYPTWWIFTAINTCPVYLICIGTWDILVKCEE